jgi:hypothetical protein
MFDSLKFKVIFFLLMALTYCQSTLIAEEHETVVLVCCSGKSGSCTLEQSFRRSGFPVKRYHGMNQTKAFEISNSAESLIVIDSIRDQISRRISSFFQNITEHLGLSENQILEIYHKEGLGLFQDKFDKIIVHLEQYYGFRSWHHYNYNCLRDGIFDFEKKYQFQQVGKLYFVNLRFDDIKQWQKIIKSIPLPINLKNFKIVQANIGKKKWYSDIYQDFCDHFTLTQGDFNIILNNNRNEIIHFWGEEGVQNFIDKWTPSIRK